MAQQVPLAGAVIVSTPQDLALIDARKGLTMFQKVNVPVLGIVEDLSTFICPHCGEPSNIFGHGGAKSRGRAARRAVPRPGAAYAGDPRGLGRGAPGGGERSDLAGRASLSRHRGACPSPSLGEEEAGARAAPRIVMEN